MLIVTPGVIGRLCVLCGKRREIERNCGQYNDGDDFCSDECYSKFSAKVDPLVKQFMDDLTDKQKEVLKTIFAAEFRKESHVAFGMLKEQLEYFGIM